MTPSARINRLEATMHPIPAQGWSATTVDELCAAAGVRKGALFHHGSGREALGIAAAEYGSRTT